MKKLFLKFSLFALLTVTVAPMLTSCSSKQREIDRLENLAEDIRQNGDDYTETDWEDAVKEYESITEDMKDEKFSKSERRKIGRLKARIVRLFMSKAGSSALEDAMNEFSGMMDEFGDSMSDEMSNFGNSHNNESDNMDNMDNMDYTNDDLDDKVNDKLDKASEKLEEQFDKLDEKTKKMGDKLDNYSEKLNDSEADEKFERAADKLQNKLEKGLNKLEKLFE